MLKIREIFNRASGFDESEAKDALFCSPDLYPYTLLFTLLYKIKTDARPFINNHHIYITRKYRAMKGRNVMMNES